MSLEERYEYTAFVRTEQSIANTREGDRAILENFADGSASGHQSSVLGLGSFAHAARAPPAGEQMKPNYPKAPHAYAGWLPLLDSFRDGDDSVLDLLREGSIEWTSIVAERWTAQLSLALERRLLMLSKQLQLWLDRSQGESFKVAGAVLNARRSLDRLREFASIPCLPENVKDHLKSEIDRWAMDTQKVLEENAAKIRTDHGQLLKAFRDNPLTASCSRTEPQRTSSEIEPAHRGRRVLL